MASGAFHGVAVIGLPDAHLGERVHAVAVSEADADTIGAALQGGARPCSPPTWCPARSRSCGRRCP